MLIDSHCHLNHQKLLTIGGAGEVVANAGRAGVGGMLTINCRISDEFPEVLAVAQQFDNVWCTVGTHPHEAA
ncbi:MAG TPA: TatD family hydrolase, partial [Alphaproteobacteria bacterium]